MTASMHRIVYLLRTNWTALALTDAREYTGIRTHTPHTHTHTRFTVVKILTRNVWQSLA